MHARRMRIITAALMVAVTVMGVGGTASAVTLVPDPDRTSTSVTPWAWYSAATTATLGNAISAGYRIVDLELADPSAPTFTASVVKNTGTYARTWWWYYGLTSSQVSSYLSSNGARLTDIERYTVSGATRFAVVMVKNSGAAAKTWRYYYGRTTSQVSSLLSTYSSRLVDLDTYSSGGSTYHDVIMIKNSGVDATDWWWYTERTASEVSSLLSSRSARLIDIERTPLGKFNVVMVKRTSGMYWWWYYGKSVSTLARYASQNGARIVDIERYLVSGVPTYAAIMVNNVNAETTRLREIMRNGLSPGSYGVYLKRIGSSTYVDLQKSVVFEPASAIKAVHHLTALRKVHAGTDSLTNNVTWYVLPSDPARYSSSADYSDDKNKCAYESDGDAITTNPYSNSLGNVILGQMMKYSDNRTTDAVYNRYGRAALNQTAADVGMTKSKVYHRIGCPGDASDQPWHHNELTLYDAGLLYEKVANGTMIGTGSLRTSFFNLMAGGAIDSASGLASIIKQEAASLGKSSSVASSFISKTKKWSKGGSYDMCPDSGDCSPPYVYVRTEAGRIDIPFKSSGSLATRSFVLGRFVDKLTLNCRFRNAGESSSSYASVCPAWKKANDAFTKVGDEMFRAQIRAALRTW